MLLSRKRLPVLIKSYVLFSVTTAMLIIGSILQLSKQYDTAHWLFILAGIVAAICSLRRIGHNLQAGTVGIDFLPLIALSTALALREYAVMVLLSAQITGNQILENVALHRSRRRILQWLDRAPKTAQVFRGKRIVETSLEKIHSGDRIRVIEGEIVAFDGIILDGSARLDTALLTGQSDLQEATIGARILAGTIVSDGSLTIKASNGAATTQYLRLHKIVQSVYLRTSPSGTRIERLSLWLGLIFLLVAIGVGMGTHDVQRFLSIVIAAVIGPLLLVIPLVYAGSIGGLLDHGIITRTISAIERLAKATTYAFSKTGVLTRGQYEVVDISTYNDFQQSTVLSYAAALSGTSQHAVAASIRAAAQTKKLKISAVRNSHAILGQGVTAMIDGKQVLLGNLSLLDKYGVARPKKFTANRIRYTAVYVAVDNELAGVISLRDSIKDSAASVVSSLRQQGIKHLILLSGDSVAAAEAVGKTLDIRDVRANLTPALKLHAVENASSRPVAYIGHDLSDAPILTAADIGIGFGVANRPEVSESADIIIMSHDIQRISDLHSATQKAVRVYRQSLIIGLGLQIVLGVAMATGRVNPVVGIILREAVVVAILVSALRTDSKVSNKI